MIHFSGRLPGHFLCMVAYGLMLHTFINEKTMVAGLSPKQSDHSYYSFAYMYGKDQVLLISEIEKITIPANKQVSPQVQTYSFTRDNNIHFKKYIRAHYPAHSAMLQESANLILFGKEQQVITEDWEAKIRAKKGQVVYIKDFSFLQPVVQDKKSLPVIE